MSDLLLQRRRMLMQAGGSPTPSNYIEFADPTVESICVSNWSSDGIGLTYQDAADVLDIGIIFKSNTSIKTFDELKYFTGISSLSDQAFYSCSALKTISMPPQITTAPREVFRNCGSLKTVNYNSAIAMEGLIGDCTNVDSRSFAGCPILTIDLPLCVNIGDNAFTWCTLLKNVNLPICVTINSHAFDYSPQLKLIELPLCSTIGSQCFRACGNLESVDLPSCTTLTADAFLGCTALKDINIPICTNIGVRVLRQCTALQSLCMLADYLYIDNGTTTHIGANCTRLYILRMNGYRTTNLDLQYWTPTVAFSATDTDLIAQKAWDIDDNGDPVDCTQFSTNKDKALWFFKNVFLPHLSPSGGLTLTLKSTVYDAVMADSYVVNYLASINWTIIRVS